MYNRIRLLVAVLLDLSCQAEARKVITLRCRFVFVYARGLIGGLRRLEVCT